MRCTKCGKDYPRTEEYFYKHSCNKDGLSRKCKNCHNKYMREWYNKNRDKVKNQHLKYLYGITLKAYNILYKMQKGKCGICNNIFKSEFNTHIDHNHKTGKIRELLCPHCNTGLGGFKDNIELLQKAIEYLRKFEVV